VEKGEHHQKLPREAFMVIRNQIDIDCPWEEGDSVRRNHQYALCTQFDNSKNESEMNLGEHKLCKEL
jgi:hypothetical protein